MQSSDQQRLPAERGQRLFLWLLPTLWAITSLWAMRHPGDEYGLWLGGSIPGAWVVFLLPNGLTVMTLMLAAIPAGVALLCLIGWGMDAVRVRWWLWLILWAGLAVAIAIAMIRQHPSYARAMSKNGSLLAYVLCGANLSLMLSTLALLPAFSIAALLRWRKRSKAGFCHACRYDLTGNTSGVCPECGSAIA